MTPPHFCCEHSVIAYLVPEYLLVMVLCTAESSPAAASVAGVSLSRTGSRVLARDFHALA